jgi:hypothetical protein
MRLRWLVIAALLAAFANWMRIFTLVIIGHVTHMQSYLVRESHLAYGWALFTLTLPVLFLIERRTPPAPLSTSQKDQMAADVRSAGVSPLAAAMTCVVLAVPSIWNIAITKRVMAVDDARVSAAAALVRGWSVGNAADASWQPVQQNADAESRQRFTRGGQVVEMYEATYLDQRIGKKLGGFANRPAGDSQILESDIGGHFRHPFTMRRIQSDGRQSLLWVSYRAGDRDFADATLAQLWYGWQAISLDAPVSRVRALHAPCEPDCAQARATLEQFVMDFGDAW